jgi:Holliday junction resolvasome RuvABC ATP-dependent DNA helicase subunit
VRQVYEPYLAARGYLVRMPRGREAAREARRRFAAAGPRLLAP